MISIEKWENYQIEELKINNNTTTTQQQTHTNKNVKNIYLFLFNKYKEQFSYEKTLKEKQEIFKRLIQENNYKDLSEYEQTKLYTELMNII